MLQIPQEELHSAARTASESGTSVLLTSPAEIISGTKLALQLELQPAATRATSAAASSRVTGKGLVLWASLTRLPSFSLSTAANNVYIAVSHKLTVVKREDERLSTQMGSGTAMLACGDVSKGHKVADSLDPGTDDLGLGGLIVAGCLQLRASNIEVD